MTTLVSQKDGADGTVATCGPARCVPELDASKPPLGSIDAEAIAAIFKALGSPIRLRLLAAMQAAPAGEACACDLVDHVDLTQPTVSHHLTVLMNAGLVRRERRGTWAWYALVPGRLDAVRELLRSPK